MLEQTYRQIKMKKSVFWSQGHLNIIMFILLYRVDEKKQELNPNTILFFIATLIQYKKLTVFT